MGESLDVVLEKRIRPDLMSNVLIKAITIKQKMPIEVWRYLVEVYAFTNFCPLKSHF